MEDERNDQQEEMQENPADKYLEEIKRLKQTTVSRDDYNAIRDENKKLLEAIVEGKTFESSSTDEATPSMEELRKELYGGGIDKMTDLDMVTKTLQLRQMIIDEGGEDPFVPVGQKISPDYNDYASAQRLAEGLQHCVDIADGDNSVFIREVARITNRSVFDNMPKR